MTVTSIGFVDGTTVAVEHEVAFAWAIIASPADAQLVHYSERANIGGMNELVLSLKSYRDRISNMRGVGSAYDPRIQRILNMEFPGEYHSAISDSGELIVDTNLANGEDRQGSFESRLPAEESMRFFLNSKIESTNDAIRQAREEERLGFRSDALSKWRVVEWFASEADARDYDLSSHPDVSLGSVLSAVHTTGVHD
ncbi:hypothetical protein ACVXZ4_10020 [Lacisediminihabitans sp. FW035]